jgi:two-component system phosphate regulon response regulator PhoB
LEQHIYVLEDNEDIRELIVYLFLSEDFQVTSFSSATAFKAGLGSVKPSLFLLDVMLPDGNGIVICNELKNDAAYRHIPVLLMSANTNTTYQGEQSKGDGFISKPFDIDNLVNRVKEMLG